MIKRIESFKFIIFMNNILQNVRINFIFIIYKQIVFKIIINDVNIKFMF